MTGLPAVVTNVGDLSDLVLDNINGNLINELDAKMFSSAILEILSDKNVHTDYSNQAYENTRKYTFYEVSRQWSSILSDAKTN